jgi:hypothetical protein
VVALSGIPEGGKSQMAGDPGEREFGRKMALALRAVYSCRGLVRGTAKNRKAGALLHCLNGGVGRLFDGQPILSDTVDMP